MARKLTRSEARWLSNAATDPMRYFHEVVNRMSKAGVDPDDKLYKLTCAAYDALHSLKILSFYEGCDGGVGKQDEREQ